MYYAVTRTNELQHHGIKGMKWGKRNGPPYPLGESDHSASEKKAGWKKSVEEHEKYRSEKSTYSHQGSDSERKNFDSKIMEYTNSHGERSIEGDYNSDEEQYDWVVGSYLRTLEKSGQDAAQKILDTKFANVEYELTITKEHDYEYGEDYTGYALKVFGDKYVYNSAGDKDYTGEAWYDDRNRK